MPATGHRAHVGLSRYETDDPLPIYIKVPIIVGLSLSLWAGIGFLISALL
jgi:hypothetical protein